MGKLISVTAYAKDSTVFTSASPMALQADDIVFVENATVTQKKVNPAASGSINTAITSNYQQENEGTRHVFLVGEAISTLVTNS